MRAVLSLNMTKLLALLLVILPILVAVQANGSISNASHHHQRRMVRQRHIEARSAMSWLTKISSKASDWMFGSVHAPNLDKKDLPKPLVGGVAVMPKMPYPYATGMIPRLASETLSGNGLPGGWMCIHVTPPADVPKQADGGAGTRSGAQQFGGQRVGADGTAAGTVGGTAAGAAGGLPGGVPGGMSGGYVGGAGPGTAGGAGGAAGGVAGGSGGGFAGGAGSSFGYPGGFGFGANTGYPGGQQGASTGSGPFVGGAGAGGMGGGMGAGTGSSGMGAGMGAGIGNGGMGAGMGAGMGNGMGSDTAAGMGGASYGVAGTGGNSAMAGGQGSTVPAGYIRYNGQLMTVDQYEQAIAGGGSPGTAASQQTLSRRDMLQTDTSTLFLNTFIHKRQASTSATDGDSDGDDSQAAPDGADASTQHKKPASNANAPKVLMCINGDPAVPAIKFNTSMTGVRIRDASTQKDGVVDITNLPNYKMPWMPFLPTADMWGEQQNLMLDQEKMIETNMTMAPPPSR